MSPFRPRRDSPATARIAASTARERTIPIRVSTFPRMSITLTSGRQRRSWARRRRLLDPTRAPAGSRAPFLGEAVTRQSLGSARRGQAARSRRGSSWTARSLALWTARSISPRIRRRSMASVKSGEAPTVRSWSPLVSVGTASNRRSGFFRRNPPRTASVWARASGLRRVPTRISSDTDPVGEGATVATPIDGARFHRVRRGGTESARWGRGAIARSDAG